MPRRKKPVQSIVVSDKPESIDFQNDLKLIKSIANYLGNYNSLQLSSAQIAQGSKIIAKAYHYANLNLGLVLGGKRAKPEAWRLDIFCYGLAQVWKKESESGPGQIPTAWQEGKKRSQFVEFAEDIARFLKFKHNRESLVNNAKRAFEITRRANVPLLSGISETVVSNLDSCFLTRNTDDYSRNTRAPDN